MQRLRRVLRSESPHGLAHQRRSQPGEQVVLIEGLLGIGLVSY